jgi:hypothetical protein
MKFLTKYGGWLASIAVGLVICLLVAAAEQGSDALTVASDACFVAGVLLAGLGGLIWIANFGGFNALGYGTYLLLRKLSPSKSKFQNRKTYLEYSLEKQETHKAPKPILVTGIVYLLLSAVFAALC